MSLLSLYGMRYCMQKLIYILFVFVLFYFFYIGSLTDPEFSEFTTFPSTKRDWLMLELSVRRIPLLPVLRLSCERGY